MNTVDYVSLAIGQFEDEISATAILVRADFDGVNRQRTNIDRLCHVRTGKVARFFPELFVP